MSDDSSDNLPGLYIHIPFCQSKCPYCDFYSITTPDLIPAYLSALEKEAQIYSAKMPSKGGTGFPACAAPAELSWTANVSPPSIKIPPAPLLQRGVKSPPWKKGDLGGFALAQAKQSCSTLSTHENESRVGANLVFALGEYKIRPYNHTSFISFDSLYLGGGTPSLLDGDQLGTLVNSLRRYFAFAPDTEFTLEANPDDVTLEKLNLWQDLGVNRLSLGAQSFDEADLRFLQRRHTARQTLAAIALIREAGFDNLGLDLMYGLPGQTLDAWINSLEMAISFAPEHLSCYQLTLAAGETPALPTPLARRLARGEFALPEEEAQREFFLLTRQFLQDRGYIHYEISNFARGEEFFCRHNRKYWNHTPYLGLGPSAHSFKAGRRWWNFPSVAQYDAAVKAGGAPVAGRETLTPEQLRLEALYLGFRTREGVALEVIQQQPRWYVVLAELEQAGLVRQGNGRVVPTPEGLVVADRLPLLWVD